MEQEKNDLLQNDLFEVNGSIDILIQEMQNLGIEYPYDELVNNKEISYAKAYNAISRMNNYLQEYNYLKEENTEFFEEEISIYIKHTILYALSIILIKVFSKTLSAKEINEIWYGLVGLLLGSVNMGIINSSINDHRNGTKDSRDLINRLTTLKENYKEDYQLAYKEIQSLFAINRILWKEIDKKSEKVLTKK